MQSGLESTENGARGRRFFRAWQAAPVGSGRQRTQSFLNDSFSLMRADLPERSRR
jgi:hypothetical protein